MSPRCGRIEMPAEEKNRDYSDRLAELESELSAHPARPAGTPQSALPSLCRVEAGRIGSEAVVQFVHRGKAFAVGHTDIAIPGAHGARGIRRIHFYDAKKKIVLGVTGEFNHQPFGVHFRSLELKTYHGGAWETPFLVITTGLRTFRADSKEDLRRIRARTAGRLA